MKGVTLHQAVELIYATFSSIQQTLGCAVIRYDSHYQECAHCADAACNMSPLLHRGDHNEVFRTAADISYANLGNNAY